MAKKSKVVRENHLIKKVEKYYTLRKELRGLIKNPNTPEDEKMKAIEKLQKLPNDEYLMKTVLPVLYQGMKIVD